MNYNPFYYNWDFVKRRKVYFTISGVLILLGLISILTMGLNLSIDFTSGTRVEVLMGQPFTDAEIQDLLKEINLEAQAIGISGQGSSLTAVLSYQGTITKEQFEELNRAFKGTYGEHVSLSESSVSPVVGQELAKKAFISLLLASIGIIIYVTVRFEYRLAISAIIALLHNVLIVVAVFSILRLEVDLTFIAAILTIVGYSINDTIVIFDRIRENMKREKVKRLEDVEHIVNKSIQQTLLRSINTVLTVIFASLALYIFGGEGVRLFSLGLTIGLFVGAYSSIFIASQIWVVWKGRELENKRNPSIQEG